MPDNWTESDQALCLCPRGPDVPGAPLTSDADCPAHAESKLSADAGER
jgi:hypothetical protein